MAYEIEPLTTKDEDAVFEFMRANFTTDEPMSVALRRDPGEREEDFWYLRLLHENLSFKAVREESPGQICGVAISNEFKFSEMLPDRTEDEDKCLKDLFDFLEETKKEFAKKLKKFVEDNKVEKIFEITIVTVGRDHRKQGLARKLTEKALALAKEKGYHLAVIECTGAYSAKMAEGLGFQCLHELPYRDFRDETGKIVFDTPAPHYSYKSLVKLLNKE